MTVLGAYSPRNSSAALRSSAWAGVWMCLRSSTAACWRVTERVSPFVGDDAIWSWDMAIGNAGHGAKRCLVTACASSAHNIGAACGDTARAGRYGHHGGTEAVSWPNAGGFCSASSIAAEQ